jgi:hypothetical protein
VPLLRVGQTFAGYELVERVSRGGMGEVWRAQKRGPDGWAKQVALKVILPTMADEERFCAMFLAEARLAAQLDHPNIVPVFAFGREDGVLWFEQEFVDGEDLNRLSQRVGRVPWQVALFITAEVLRALRHGWEARGLDGKPLGVVHRDVKPHNVLVSRGGSVKLMDFGVAKAMALTTGSQSEIKGTAGYIAPEVIEGEAPTHQADVFGAGLILWELLVGRKLFDGETEATRIKKTFECAVPPLRGAGVDAPPEVERVLRWLLAREPAQRAPSAEKAIEAILAAPGGRDATAEDVKRFLGGGPPAAAASAGAPQTGSLVRGEVSGAPARGGRRARWIAIALVPVAAVMVTLAVTLRPGGEEQKEPAAVPQVVKQEEPPPPEETPPAQPKQPREEALATVRLLVTPPDARVEVEGRGVSPGPSPFEIVEVDTQKPMRVKISAPGYEDWERELAVTGPETTETIELQRKRGRRVEKHEESPPVTTGETPPKKRIVVEKVAEDPPQPPVETKETKKQGDGGKKPTDDKDRVIRPE